MNLYKNFIYELKRLRCMQLQDVADVILMKMYNQKVYF